MHANDPFAHAENTARTWLAAVGDALGTEDRHAAYRAVRAWLHTVRDRLTVEAAVHFAAQLPELLRGVYFEGWTPSHVPTRYDVPGFVGRFAGSAGIARAEVPATAAAVTAAFDRLCSPGRLDHVLKLLPARLVDLLTGDRRAR
ncbi:DUF2267 domain-containing protein [Amycolatopsis stemonae]